MKPSLEGEEHDVISIFNEMKLVHTICNGMVLYFNAIVFINI